MSDFNALEEALAITKTQAGVRNMTEEEITSMVRKLTLTFRDLTTGAPMTVTVDAPEQDARQFHTDTEITCMVCGKKFKMLTRRHLATHGMTKEQYMAKFGITKDMSFSVAAIGKMHRKLIKKTKIWEHRRKNAGDDTGTPETPEQPMEAASTASEQLKGHKVRTPDQRKHSATQPQEATPEQPEDNPGNQ